ncbi:MAG: hypothetical protein IT350_09445 [Deltaproteobacteria bacterium]|nr:hypothetical protein [Deltaproteobacteria bacterium]
MKLALIGGGGIRGPLFVESLLGRQKRSGRELITELCLHDVQPRRLDVIGPFAKRLAEEAGSPLRITTTTDLVAALDGASHVVTTIRAGFEQGRIHDEKVSLACGCIGQETVGPGGFAMAIRAIPEVLHIAQTAARVAPGAWIINFTNPAGLLAQAMQDFGFRNSIGICDSSDTIARDTAFHFGVDHPRVTQRVFGLNHCSFTYEAAVDSADRLGEMLANDDYMDAFMGIYEKSMLREFGLLPNEYLYYYFYPEAAYEAMRAETQTRGEQILALNTRFFSGAWDDDHLRDIDEIRRLHDELLGERSRTYMQYAWEETAAGERPKVKTDHGGEGYAGVALDFIEARSSDAPRRIVLNYLNGDAIPFFSAHDTAELTYEVSRDAIKPLGPSSVPPRVEELLRTVKYYENLTSLCARFPTRKAALWALESNPLVHHAHKAERLLDGFIKSHGGVFERFA